MSDTFFKDDKIFYENLVENAILNVVKDVLKDTEQNGLRGNHFLFAKRERKERKFQ